MPHLEAARLPSIASRTISAAPFDGKRLAARVNEMTIFRIKRCILTIWFFILNVPLLFHLCLYKNRRES